MPTSSAPYPPGLSLELAPEAIARAQGVELIAGVDEAGRGPWAGPVVAASVVLPRGRRRLLRGVRIDDCKLLTARQRQCAYQAILESAQVGVGIVSAEVIDAHNILNATLVAMQQAVEDLAPRPELVLIDGDRAPRLSLPCWTVVSGDRRSLPIACASIVAKVVRDSLMRFYHQLFPAYAFDRHKGYGTRQHREALLRCGPSVLHRMSFQPVRSAVRDLIHV